nr:hypothetical protein [Tanacetum cinerariifolium]
MHVILIRGVDVFFRLSRLFFRPFKTLCLLNYALMKRHDYDITVFFMKRDVAPGLENDDSKGEIDVVEELRVDNSIFNSENELSDNEESDFDNPSFPRPPPEPPDADFKPDSREEILVVMNTINELECLDPRDEIDVFTNHENDDYFPFMFVIRIFLPYLICSKMFLSFLSAESEDTIFDPAQLRFSFPFALPKDQQIQGSSRASDSLFDNEASDFDNPSFPRPPPEPPDAEFDLEPDFEEEISVVMNDNDEI